MTRLLTLDDALLAGVVVDRPNRFVVRVAFDGPPERAFLGDPGALKGIVEPGRTILCTRADDPDRATGYDAIAVELDGMYVSVRAALANEHFERALERDAIRAFEGYEVREREPALPDHGRTDFLLDTPRGEPAYVEVKSATYAEGGVAKFPDRQTERGRRHLRSLERLRRDGNEAHVAFVVQRPDVTSLEPYREVDPEFAELLARVHGRGVGLHAIVTAFEPPAYRLCRTDLPIRLG